MNVFVTGGAGYIGSHILNCNHLYCLCQEQLQVTAWKSTYWPNGLNSAGLKEDSRKVKFPFFAM